MESSYQNCWEFREGRLFAVNDPIEGDGDLDSDIFACGYRQEVSSKSEASSSSAQVTLYKNHELTNGKPLFYMEFMGAFEGIGALIANDFSQLVSTLNHLNGILLLFKLDQSTVIGDLVISKIRPQK